VTIHDVYAFVSGPLVWVAFAVFFGGLLYKLLSLALLARKKDPMVYEYMSFKYAMRSILRWNIPYATRNMRLHPVTTFVWFTFHFCLIVAPVFLSAHLILLEEAFGVRIPALPDGVADVMTMIVIASLIYYTLRRIVVPEVRYVTFAKEYLILLLVLAPFLTGLLAYHQIGPYEVMLILHILTGEILLVALPFTWLSHMLTGFLIRAYMGSEFGSVRHARDW
jgi:nitrate reductase gamma subunit